MNRTRRIQIIVLIVLASLPWSTPARSGASVGGTDVLVHEITPVVLGRGADMDIDTNGNIYTIEYYPDTPLTSFYLRRSQDGGETWSLYGFFSFPAADGASNPTIHVAEGEADRIFIAYERLGDIWVAYADIVPGIPSFTHVLAIDGPDDLAVGYIESDASEYGTYYLYLVASERTGPVDVYFARSTNLGASWDPAYPIGDAATADEYYTSPRLSYSQSILHCVMDFSPESGGLPDSRIRYRRMVNFGANGLADWSGFTDVTSGTDDLRHQGMDVAASHVSSKVVIAATTDTVYGAGGGAYTLIRSSSDGGLSWPGANEAVLPELRMRELVALPSGGFALATSLTENKAYFHKATDADPLAWSTAQISDRNDNQVFLQGPNIDYDATRGEQVALVWFHQQSVGSDSIMFDAEWRAATGFPSVAAGFPVSPGSPIIVSPALATLDGDSHLEILVGTADGMLRAYNSDGSVVPGWPANVGNWPVSLPRNATIAAGDLDEDGRVDVVAGSGGGEVYVFDNDGSPRTGWPQSLGNDPVYVSIGRITGASPRNVVACSGDKVWVFEPDGGVAPGFPVTVSGTVPGAAAIGDLDQDGQNEIVAASGTRVNVIDESGGIKLSKLLSPVHTISAQVSLADMDLNGDLEIAVPTTSGNVHMLDYPGGAYLPGWPVATGLGTPVTAIALVNNSGTMNPEAIFAERDSSVYMYHYDGVLNPNWPKHTGYGWNVYGAPTIDFIEDVVSSDVLIGSRDSQGHAFRNVSGAVPGWPRFLGDQIEVSPASGDIDFDGQLEVVFGGFNGLWMIDVNQAIARDQPREIWPMMGYNAQRTACLACEPDVVVSVDEPGRLRGLSLAPPVPNPSAGHQLFRFALAREGHVRLTIFDASGRVVRQALDRSMHAGQHAFEWDGRDAARRPLAAGVYFARLEVTDAAGTNSLTQRLVVLR